MKTFECELSDTSTFTDEKVTVKIKHEHGGICIYPEGYGDALSEDGQGSPIVIEFWKGGLRIVAWTDINHDEPSEIICMEGAREDKREKETS